jgi:hypothetical protein
LNYLFEILNKLIYSISKAAEAEPIFMSKEMWLVARSASVKTPSSTPFKREDRPQRNTDSHSA